MGNRTVVLAGRYGEGSATLGSAWGVKAACLAAAAVYLGACVASRTAFKQDEGRAARGIPTARVTLPLPTTVVSVTPPGPHDERPMHRWPARRHVDDTDQAACTACNTASAGPWAPRPRRHPTLVEIQFPSTSSVYSSGTFFRPKD
jgi:hypothetical protein